MIGFYYLNNWIGGHRFFFRYVEYNYLFKCAVTPGNFLGNITCNFVLWQDWEKEMEFPPPQTTNVTCSLFVMVIIVRSWCHSTFGNAACGKQVGRIFAGVSGMLCFAFVSLFCCNHKILRPVTKGNITHMNIFCNDHCAHQQLHVADWEKTHDLTTLDDEDIQSKQFL